MNPTKRFLIAFAVVYIIIGLGVNLTFGPPTLSSDYLSEYKAQNDYYLTIVKSEAYKRWNENARVNPPDEAMNLKIAFVEAYEANPDFVAEQKRRGRYDTISDVFNSFMLIVLIVRLGRGPFLNFVDGLVSEERERIETVEQDRSDAARRRTKAQRKLERFEEERAEANRQVEARIASETATIEESTQRAIGQVHQEAEDRKRQEEVLARQRLKEEMVDAAIDILSTRYRDEHDSGMEAALAQQFLDHLGTRA